MNITVREMGTADRLAWAEMRSALWPQDSLTEHMRAIEEMLSGVDVWGFIAETSEAGAAGFAELAIRKYANGCMFRPVPFLEGIWVKPQFRRQGVGASLIRHLDAFLVRRGFREICSDAEIHNLTSHAAHLGWGFSETERVVYFRKPLTPQ